MHSKLFPLWFSSLLLTSLTGGVRADWWSKTKRDIPADSGGVVIPLSTDALGRYVTTVGMGNQNKPGPIQNLSFVLSASSPYTVAAGVNCTTCVSQVGSSSLYNASLSQTEVSLNSTKSISMGETAVKGDIISEACALMQQNHSLWWYPNQTVVVANQSDSFFANGAAGMVGLGRSAGSASFIDTVFRTHGAWQNLTLALALNGAGTPQPGVMDVRATDPSLYSGDIQYYPVVAAAPDVPVSYPADWSLHLDSWTIDAGDIKTEHTTGGVAIVEPYFPEIRFPQDQAYLFYRDIQDAVLVNTSTGLTWNLPCKSSISLDVIFSGTPFTVGADKLITGNTNSGNCTGVVMGWDSPFVQSYMLGKAFAETVYIVYNANRNGTGDSIGFAPRSSGSGSSGMSNGAVAGISVGVTIAFFLLLLLFWLWWRYRRAVRASGVTEGKGKHKIEPYTPTSSSAPMMNLSPNSSHRPYIIEQGPIGGDVGMTAALLGNTSPEATPNSSAMTPSHRRKTEEAGFLVTNGGGRGSVSSRARPSSSQTTTTSTDFMQNLPPLQMASGAPDPRHLSAMPSSPGGAMGGGTVIQAPPTPTNPDPPLARHFSTDTRILSPMSPQIHYHIHVSPGATAPSFLPGTLPPGAIIHEYNEEEPAPEYSERPRSRSSSVSESVTSPAPTTTGTRHSNP